MCGCQLSELVCGPASDGEVFDGQRDLDQSAKHIRAHRKIWHFSVEAANPRQKPRRFVPAPDATGQIPAERPHHSKQPARRLVQRR